MSRGRLLTIAAVLGVLGAGCGAPPAPSDPTEPAAAGSPAGPSSDGSQAAGSAPGTPSAAGRGLAFGFDVGEIKRAREYLAEPRFAAADFERGELLSLACQACHTLRQGQRHNVGPNLFGIFGREAASAPDFAYSEALEAIGLVWTPKALEAWLIAPAEFVIGNNMIFAGYASQTDRRDLIAFLLRATSPEPGAGAAVE